MLPGIACEPPNELTGDAGGGWPPTWRLMQSPTGLPSTFSQQFVDELMQFIHNEAGTQTCETPWLSRQWGRVNPDSPRTRHGLIGRASVVAHPSMSYLKCKETSSPFLLLRMEARGPLPGQTLRAPLTGAPS